MRSLEQITHHVLGIMHQLTTHANQDPRPIINLPYEEYTLLVHALAAISPVPGVILMFEDYPPKSAIGVWYLGAWIEPTRKRVSAPLPSMN